MTITGASRKQAGLFYDKGGMGFNVLHPDYGAKGNARYVIDGAITTGTPNFTSATAAFVPGDAGKGIVVNGAGAAGIPLVTTILTYVSATAVTLAANASTTVSAQVVVVGTDDTAAFQAVALTPQPFIPPGTYRVDGQITGLAGQKWIMPGVTIVTAGSTIITFNWDTVSDWAMTGSFKIIGGGTTVGTAKGIRVKDCGRWRIDHPTCWYMRGHGIYMEPGSNTRSRGEGGVCESPSFRYCYIGWQDVPNTGAEYCTVFNARATFCTSIAILTSAGNTRWVGGHVLDNLNDGVIVQGGANHAHGGLDGVHSNHNVRYNWMFAQVTNGMSLIGCNSYALGGSGSGSIYFDRCKGIVWTGGIIDSWVYSDKDGSSGQNIIRGAFCPGPSGDIVVSHLGTAGEDLVWFDRCYGAGAYTSGISINDPSPVYVLASRSIGTTQALTNGVAAILTFDTETFDRRAAFVNTTGIFTVPAGQDGMYRIKASLYFKGTAMSVTASYVEVQINGTARSLYLPGIFGTTLLTIPVMCEVYLAAGNTVKLNGVITGTTPTHGGTTYDSEISIERIS